MFIVPDELLDTMNYDNCHKTLSVGPIKVYRNRKTKCGRCSEDDDDGAVSQYKIFVEHGVFKCVNRFEGCRQLLSHSQVEDHESSCISYEYVCPMCPEETRILGYLLIKHFKEEHKGYFISTPMFELDVTIPCAKTYLHKVGDNLFFIDCKVGPLDTITLNTRFLGEETKAEDMKQTFTIKYGGENSIETVTRACGFYNCEHSEGFILMKPDYNSVYVALKLTLGERSVCSFISDHKFWNTQKEIQLPRKISLSPSLKKNSELYLNSNSTLLMEDDLSISPYCYNCTLPLPVSEKYFEVKGFRYQPVCDICLKVSQMKNKFELHNKLFNFSSDNPIIYSCIWSSWGCTETYFYEFILEHESNCSHQPLQPCPAESCSHVSKLVDLKDHFKETHPRDSISVLPFFECNSDVICKSKNLYVWVQSDFICIEIISYKESIGELCLKPCTLRKQKENIILITFRTKHSISSIETNKLLKFKLNLSSVIHFICRLE